MPIAQAGKSRPGRSYSQYPGQTSQAEAREATTPSSSSPSSPALTPQPQVAASLTALCRLPRGPRPPPRHPSKGAAGPWEAGVSPWSRGTAWPRTQDPMGPVDSPFGPSHPDTIFQVLLLEAGRPASPTRGCDTRPPMARVSHTGPRPASASSCPRGLRARGGSAGAGEGAASAPPGSLLQPGPLPPTPWGNLFQMWPGEDGSPAPC